MITIRLLFFALLTALIPAVGSAYDYMADGMAYIVNGGGERPKGDANNDGLVNGSDLNALISVILKQVPTPEGDDLTYFDLNDDGEVDGTDLNVLIDVVLGKIVLPGLDTETFTVNGVTFTMVRVEHGTFTMGATAEQGSDANDRERPAHQVTLTKDYYIGQTEVTQALWQAVMGSNPSFFQASTDPAYGTNFQRPVEQVSWNDCQEFITKLNQLTGREFRLPTEAEWEFAARGGNLSQGHKYAGSDDIAAVAWYSDNSYALGSSSPDYGTHTVATKAANELGLYDMSGNVNELCQDWYGSYSSEAQIDPTGPSSASYRVCRGASWRGLAESCRVSWRSSSSPTGKIIILGLRLAL